MILEVLCREKKDEKEKVFRGREASLLCLLSGILFFTCFATDRLLSGFHGIAG